MDRIPGLRYEVSITCMITEDMPHSAIESLMSDLSLAISGLLHRSQSRSIDATVSVKFMLNDLPTTPMWQLTTNMEFFPIRIRGVIEPHGHFVPIHDAIMRLLTAYLGSKLDGEGKATP
jgi:hypothetical protein